MLPSFESLEDAVGDASRAVSPALIQTLRHQFALDLQGEHGVSHWARVRRHGQILGAKMGADLRVCGLFAFLHDSCRLDEWEDPDHGRRAAEYSAQLRQQGLFELDDHAFGLLQQACIGHSEGRIEADITVQVCWDSDRLDLARVGIIPDPKYLCTTAAKEPAVIVQAIAWSERWLARCWVEE